MNILDKIIEQKRAELPLIRQMEKEGSPSPFVKRRSLIDRIKQSNKMGIIAEFKRASPSKGLINGDADIKEQVKAYEGFGADAVSVLTDETFFKGSFSDLTSAREVIDLPILCKDFIIDKVQIDLAKKAGADLILLIAAVLDEKSLVELYEYASHSGLEVLVEVHNEEELQKALKTGSPLIGINNRNLKTFAVSLNTTETLAALVKNPDIFIISESGIKNQEDVFKVAAAGAKGILVGETMMKACNLEEVFKSLKVEISKELIR